MRQGKEEKKLIKDVLLSQSPLWASCTRSMHLKISWPGSSRRGAVVMYFALVFLISFFFFFFLFRATHMAYGGSQARG